MAASRVQNRRCNAALLDRPVVARELLWAGELVEHVHGTFLSVWVGTTVLIHAARAALDLR
eukprot:904974-Pyramimonas_sp.AAC.1